MYNVSSEYLNVISNMSRAWDLYIDVVLSDGTSFRLTRDDVDLGSLVFKEGATCSDTVQIGSTFSNSVEFRIVNAEAQYTGYDFYRAKVFPHVGLDLTGSGRYEYVPLGEFNILEPVKKFSTISIVGFDNMSLTNRVFDFSQMVFPTNPVTVFDEVVYQCNISYDSYLRTQIAELSYDINSLLTNDPTCRDILAGFGVMLMRNLRFNREGVLEAFWYTSSGRKTTPQTRVGNSRYDDNQIIVTGVYLEDAYGNTFSVGTEEYAVELPTSPILQGSDMCLPLLETALSHLQTLSYRAATIYWIGDPAIQAGDLVEHTDTAVGTCSLPIMRSIYKFAGTATIESLGMDSTTMGQQTSTDKKLKKAFSRADRDRVELETKISQTADEVLIQASEKFADKSEFAELVVQSENIRAEVSQQSQELGDVRTELTRVEQTARDVSVTVQDIKSNGTDKVNGLTVKVDIDGLHVHKPGEEMVSTLDPTGLYVEQNDDPVLVANADGVNARDVTVRNYLIVGAHSRFEDYIDDYDREGTACFWV